MQLEENLNLIKLSIWIYFGEEYHYTLRLIRWLHTFSFSFFFRMKMMTLLAERFNIYVKEVNGKKYMKIIV